MALCSFGHALDHLFYVVERCLGAWWGIAWGPPPDSKKVKKNQEGKRSKKDKKDEGKKDTKTIKKSKKGKKGEKNKKGNNDKKDEKGKKSMTVIINPGSGCPMLCPYNDLITLDVDASDTIASVKRTIERLKYIRQINMYLIFAGRGLADANTLMFYKIPDKAHLVLQVRSGTEDY